MIVFDVGRHIGVIVMIVKLRCGGRRFRDLAECTAHHGLFACILLIVIALIKQYFVRRARARLHLHVCFILQLVLQRHITLAEASVLAEYLASGPGKYLPALQALLLVRFEEVLVGLEVGQHGHVAPEAVPAKLEDCQRQEFHDVEGGTNCAAAIFQEHRSDGFFCIKRTLLHIEHATAISSAALSKYEEGSILSRLLNELLAIANSP